MCNKHGQMIVLFSVLFYMLSICAGRKNVLFLVADDLRVQLGSYNGNNFASPIHPKMHTPNLDKLASKSLLLKRAYVQQALCAPSRTSLLTGRRPDTTRVYDLDSYWRNVTGNFTTIPQYFKEHGYKSIGMGKIFHHGESSGTDDPISWSTRYFYPHRTDWEKSKARSWKAVPDSQLKNKPLVDKQVADNALSVLQALAQDGRSGGAHPWFLAVGFMRPHLPFVFPASMLHYYPQSNISLPENGYAPVNMPDIAWSRYNELQEFHDVGNMNLTGYINTTIPDWKVLQLRRAYYSSVTWVDLQVGRVLDELEKLGLADNTIISFFGDHGWQLGEHGEWCKHTNFDIATHAPMMIRVPGLTDSGIETEKLTEFVDLFPTLVEAAGLPSLRVCPDNSLHVRVCREGSSLVPLMKNSHANWKNASFSQYPRSLHGHKAMGYTITTEKYRYTEWAKFHYAPTYRPDWRTLYGVELYDHSKDPEENTNRAQWHTYANIRQELSRQLRAGWRNILPAASHSGQPVVVG